MSELDSRLQKGMVALQEGRREEARRLLAQAVMDDPDNAAAWLWLSRCVDDQHRRRECLAWALSVDPANEAVRQALGQEAGARLRQIVGADPGTANGHTFHRKAYPCSQPIRDERSSHGLDRSEIRSLPGRDGRLSHGFARSEICSLPDRDGRSSHGLDRSEIRSLPDRDGRSSHGLARSEIRSLPDRDGRSSHGLDQSEIRSLPDRDDVNADGRSSGRWNSRLALSALMMVVVALACVLAPRIGWPASLAQPVGGEMMEASGIIQAEEVLIASEWGGQIAAIPVDEGDAVAAGDVVVQLDTALLDAQIKAAQAAVAMAEARLSQAKAGVRPGQIAVAEAQLAQAEAARAAATQAVSDTLALVENPQDIRLQIAVTRAQAEAAQYHVARAVTLKDAVEVGKQKFEDLQAKWGGGGRYKVLVRSGPVSELPAILPPEIVALLPTLGDGVHTFGDLELHLHGETFDIYKWLSAHEIHIPLELHLMPNSWWQAWVGVNAAVAQQKGIEASLAHLDAQRTHPQSLEAKADESLAALAQAEAQMAVVRAQVDGLKAGATTEQIAALEARVAQAQAGLDSLLTRRVMLKIASPIKGVVMEVAVHPGEVAAAGAMLMAVADLAEVHLTLYLPETRIGQVRLGQKVGVTVDSFPGRVFEGEVTHIADRAEFTPRNVATTEERVNLVFAVEVRLPNDEGLLKPGMPADAVFGN